MEYEGLGQDDLANVRALNRAWLCEQYGRKRGPGRLTEKERERLAGAPFLLFSFREQDDRWWQYLLDADSQRDLLVEAPPLSDTRRTLQVAGLAFLWELARHNPYAARVVSGAPVHWCEQIAGATLVRVLKCAEYCDMLEPRFESASSLHQRLVRAGSSPVREMRRTAHLGALQAMLTSDSLVPYQRLAAAACRMSGIERSVADKV